MGLLALQKQTEDPGWWEHERRPYSNNLIGTSINQWGRGEEADGSNVAWLGPHKCLNMEISCITHKIKPITHSYPSYMERCPEILETLSAKPSQRGKIPILKGFQFAFHHYINTKPPLFSGMQKLASSLTIEFIETSHSLTWLSEGFWPLLHLCLLFGPFILIHRYPFERLGAYNSLTILAHH